MVKLDLALLHVPDNGQDLAFPVQQQAAHGGVHLGGARFLLGCLGDGTNGGHHALAKLVHSRCLLLGIRGRLRGLFRSVLLLGFLSRRGLERCQLRQRRVLFCDEGGGALLQVGFPGFQRGNLGLGRFHFGFQLGNSGLHLGGFFKRFCQGGFGLGLGGLQLRHLGLLSCQAGFQLRVGIQRGLHLLTQGALFLGQLLQRGLGFVLGLVAVGQFALQLGQFGFQLRHFGVRLVLGVLQGGEVRAQLVFRRGGFIHHFEQVRALAGGGLPLVVGGDQLLLLGFQLRLGGVHLTLQFLCFFSRLVQFALYLGDLFVGLVQIRGNPAFLVDQYANPDRGSQDNHRQDDG